MSSSLAYNNVLLKTPVQPQPAAVPKRDYQNDSAASDFQQTLKDVHDTSLRQKDIRDKDARVQNARAQNTRNQDLRDSTRRQDEKLAKANSHKTEVPADNRKQTDEVSTQKKSVDNAAQSSQNIAADNTCAKDKTISNKNTSNKQIKKTDDTTEAATSAAAAITTVVVMPSDTELPTALTIASASAQTDETSLTTETPLDLIAANLTNNQSAESADSLLTAQAVTDELNGDSVQATIDSALQQTIAQQTVADSASEQAKLTSISQSAEQNPIILPGVTSAVISATTSLPTDTAAPVLASQAADVFGAEKSSSKTLAGDASSGVDVEAESASVATQMVDPKSTFEKMLQSVARSGVTTTDDSAPVNTANNPNSSTQSNAMDSLLRLSDAQTPATRSFVVQTAVPVPVGQPKWSEAVGEKVLWLAAQNVTSAEINLHPKDLGPIQVKVSVNQEQATVSFTSHHAVVREVLDQNLNRLRDMFNEQGLNLVNVDVSDKSFSRQQGEGKDQKGQGGTTNSLVEDETPVAVSAIIQQRLVDHYA